MKNFTILILSIVLLGCNNTKKSTENVEVKSGVIDDIELEVFDFNGLKEILNRKDDTVYVINFWATWCAPCVKELPYFEKINSKYEASNVKVILVSLDFPHVYDSKLKPFIRDKKIASKVVALDDADMNTWIPKVDASWSGSIPATIIYKNDQRAFFEKSFTYEELETELKQFLK